MNTSIRKVFIITGLVVSLIFILDGCGAAKKVLQSKEEDDAKNKRNIFIQQFLAEQKTKVKIFFTVRVEYLGKDTPRFTDAEMKNISKLIKESAEKVFDVVEEGSPEKVNSYGFLQIYRKGNNCFICSEMNSVSGAVGRGVAGWVVKVNEIPKEIDNYVFQDYGWKYINSEYSFKNGKDEKEFKGYHKWGDGTTKPAKEINIDRIIKEEDERNADSYINYWKDIEMHLDVGPRDKENINNVISVLKTHKNPAYRIYATHVLRDIGINDEVVAVLKDVVRNDADKNVCEEAKWILEKEQERILSLKNIKTIK